MSLTKNDLRHMVTKPSDIILYHNQSLKSDSLYAYMKSFKLILNAFGHHYDDPTMQTDMRVMGDIELLYVIDGISYITIEETRYTCGPGDLAIIPPFTRHRIQTEAECPHDHYWMHIDVSPIYKAHAFIRMLMESGGYVRSIGIEPKIIMLYETMVHEGEKREPGALVLMEALAKQIVALFCRHAWSQKNQPPETFDNGTGAEQSLIDQCMKYVECNLDKSIQVKTLSEWLYVSTSSIYKAFRHTTHMSPSEFITAYKMKVAAHRMRDEKLSIKQLASTLGYSSPYHFTAVFKKIFDVCPRSYRRNLSRFLD